MTEGAKTPVAAYQGRAQRLSAEGARTAGKALQATKNPGRSRGGGGDADGLPNGVLRGGGKVAKLDPFVKVHDRGLLASIDLEEDGSDRVDGILEGPPRLHRQADLGVLVRVVVRDHLEGLEKF